MKTSVLSKQQLDLIVKYGRCWECGAPREPQFLVDGHVVTPGSITKEMVQAYEMTLAYHLVCENGHEAR